MTRYRAKVRAFQGSPYIRFPRVLALYSYVREVPFVIGTLFGVGVGIVGSSLVAAPRCQAIVSLLW